MMRNLVILLATAGGIYLIMSVFLTMKNERNIAVRQGDMNGQDWIRHNIKDENRHERQEDRHKDNYFYKDKGKAKYVNQVRSSYHNTFNTKDNRDRDDQIESRKHLNINNRYFAQSVKSTKRPTPPYRHGNRDRYVTPYVNISNVLQKIRRWEKTLDNQKTECNFTKLQPSPIDGADRWQTASSDRLYVYSAFLDTRVSGDSLVRVIGVSSSSMISKYWCRLWYSNQTQPAMVKLSGSRISEGAGLRFVAWIFHCRSKGVPHSVSIVTKKCETATNLLPVHVIELTNQRPDVNYTVCCTPINRHYDNINEFVEMIEVNSMFGANRFVFYNHSIGHMVEKYIKFYTKKGKVEIYPWDIPLDVDGGKKRPDIHYFGQLAALNDCLYRNMARSKFIVFTDLDEIIVPMKQNSWDEVINSILQKNDDVEAGDNIHSSRYFKFGAIVFRCLFFKKEWPDDETMTSNRSIIDFKIQSLLKTKREKTIWPYMQRSKYIAIPESLEIAGIHFVHRFFYPITREYSVTPETGLVFHYRWWDDPSPKYFVERRMHQFMNNIITRISTIHRTVMGT